jgi:hypothetical protein
MKNKFEWKLPCFEKFGIQIDYTGDYDKHAKLSGSQRLSINEFTGFIPRSINGWKLRRGIQLLF